MQTILGPFHPYLETALAEKILKYKTVDPLCPLLILVPSDALRRRLKIFLTRERSLSFINLQLLTFHQLSLRLFSETNRAQGLALNEDLFLEEILRHIIRTGQPGTHAFAGIEERAGGCSALWQTLRDLRDGLVDPAIALEALREGHFAQRTSQRTSDLLALLQTGLDFCAEKNLQDHSDLDKAAAQRSPESRLLRQFRRIFYYGFYDLTQIQLDFFHAVSRHYPTTLFFPLLSTTPPHDGWKFAERFYQRYVQGRGGVDSTRNLIDEPDQKNGLPLTFRIFDEHSQREYQPLPTNWRCRIFNTFGIHDEISAVAKEVLRLVSDDGMEFDQIGVVARTLDVYGATMKEVFAQHQIPITGAVEEPLVQFPLTKAAMLLLNLPAKDYLRSHVIDLLSSPYFQLTPVGGESADLRPDLWDLATRELAICKGLQEWQRLERYTTKGLTLSQLSSDDEPRTIIIAAAQLRALANILNGLADDLSHLPAQTSWSQYARSWKALLNKYLGITPEPAADSNHTDILVRNQILSTLDQIARLDAVESNVLLYEFSQTFQHWLERGTLVATNQNAHGVAVSNATAARGLGFRGLFIVGMNEGVFPRTIREDAFLRDRDREVLERDLGYKVSQKLAAFDEEKLVFSLLVNSARERLYCSFQRSDESGRVLAPSWYLTELKRTLGGGDKNQIIEATIPRSITHKADSQPFDHEELLLPEELAIRLTLAGKESTPLIEGANLSPALFKRGLETIERIDLSTERLGVYDGMIESPAEYWRGLSERGLSPTGLEIYARCPFQYFARQVLGLERLETPENTMGPSLAEAGELGHLILKLTYQELIQRGYFTRDASTGTIDTVLAAAAQSAFADYEANNPIGYPLIWETLRETLTQLVRDVVDRDLQELAESGYVPVNFETEIAGRLPAAWPEPLSRLAIHGRMDRIDIDPVRNRMRVVDYKFKFGAHPSAEDNNLSRAALRGERLQPPFYSLLGKAKRELEEPQGADAQIEASFYYIAARWNDGPLVTKSFGAEELSGKIGEEIRKTIAQLATGIQSGQFFIQRGEHCRYCEVAEICRKNHPPSLWRAENDPITGPHRQLREKDPEKI
jgi:ATP-dependent helicase/nuclease subunit B